MTLTFNTFLTEFLSQKVCIATKHQLQQSIIKDQNQLVDPVSQPSLELDEEKLKKNDSSKFFHSIQNSTAYGSVCRTIYRLHSSVPYQSYYFRRCVLIYCSECIQLY